MNPRLGIMCAHFENVDFLNCREGLPSTVWGADGPIYMAVLYGPIYMAVFIWPYLYGGIYMALIYPVWGLLLGLLCALVLA